MDDASSMKYRARLDEEMPANLKTMLDYCYASVMSEIDEDDPVKLAFDDLTAWLKIRSENPPEQPPILLSDGTDFRKMTMGEVRRRLAYFKKITGIDAGDALYADFEKFVRSTGGE